MSELIHTDNIAKFLFIISPKLSPEVVDQTDLSYVILANSPEECWKILLNRKGITSMQNSYLYQYIAQHHITHQFQIVKEGDKVTHPSLPMEKGIIAPLYYANEEIE